MANNKRLNATIAIGGSISSSLKSAFGSATDGLKKIGAEIRATEKRQSMLGKTIQAFGKVTGNTRLQVDGLRSSYAESIRTIDRLRAAQNRLSTAQSRYNTLTKASHKIGGAAVAAGIGSAVLAAPSIMAVKEAKSYQNESARLTALGLGDKVNRQAFEFAKDLKTFGTSQLENLTLTRDALSIFTDMHHTEFAVPTLAKMKFGNAAFYGSEHGADNESKFMDMLKVIELRGGANSREDFDKQANMVQRVVSATGGRVGADEWRNVISTGGTAAKLMRDDAFYYQLEPLVQMMGGDKVGTGLSASYASLYQGRTTKRAAENLDKYGLIGDKTKVKNDKVGQVSQLNPGALLGSKLFRESQFEWVKQVLLPTLEKKGVTDQKEIVDVIASFVSNKKGADLLAAMVMQQKLIDKDEHKNRGAYDIDQTFNAGKQTASGKELDAKAKVENLKLQFGNDILPLYTRGLELATGALERLNGFMERNPRLTKAMAVGVAGLSAGLAVLAPVLVTVGGALSAYAGYSLLMAKFATSAAEGAAAMGFVGRTLSLVRGAGTIAMGAIEGIGAVLATISLPVAAVIGAVVAGGILIYKYWEPLKAFFGGLWDGFAAGVAPIRAAIADAFEPVVSVIAPVVMPILSGIGGWVKSAIGWFGELLKPIDKASETTKAFGQAGMAVGGVIASAFEMMLKPIEMVGHVIKATFGMIGSAWDYGMAHLMAPDVGQNKGAPVPPPLPEYVPSVGGGAKNDNRQFHIQLTQQPGQSPTSTAAAVATRLGASAAQASPLFDLGM